MRPEGGVNHAEKPAGNGSSNGCKLDLSGGAKTTSDLIS